MAVHLPERVGDELQAGAVWVAEVHRGAALQLVVDAGSLQVGAQAGPSIRFHGDSHVVKPAQHFGVRPEVEAREVEERDEVALAQIEEEVVGARVIPVFEDVRQGHLEDLLVEAHSALDIGGQEGQVVHAASR